MAVSSQIGAVQPKGIKKKNQLYSPLIQEQAKQGIATQMVLNQKDKEQYNQEQAFQQAQFDTANQQWSQDFALQQEQMEQQKKKDTYGLIFGGLSTAASLYDAFDLDLFSSIF